MDGSSEDKKGLPVVSDSKTSVASSAQEEFASIEDPSIPPGEAGIRHLLVRANLYRLRKQYAEAVECCIAAIRRRPDCQAAHSMLGDIYRDQENWAEAVRWYRMAVEIRPSAVDETRLQRAEQELLRHQRALPLSTIQPDPELRAGTMPLMGLPPQRWLMGLWLVSLGFLGGVLLMLIAMRIHPTTLPHPPTYVVPSTTGGFGSPTALPPTYYTNPVIPPSTPSSQATSTKPISTSSPMLSTINPSKTDTSPATLPTLPFVPPSAATPLQIAPSQITRAPNEPAPPSASTQPSTDSPNLTDGFRLTEVRNLGDGQAAVFLLAPPQYATDLSDAAQATLVHNIYRAARYAFTNTYYARATVLVQILSTQGTPIAIAQADLYRDDAMNLDPENASLQDLMTHLQNFRRFGSNEAIPNGESP